MRNESNCASICSMTGSKWFSAMVYTQITTCHWVAQSMALM
jgi:hypothetical protein